MLPFSNYPEIVTTGWVPHTSIIHGLENPWLLDVAYNSPWDPSPNEICSVNTLWYLEPGKSPNTYHESGLTLVGREAHGDSALHSHDNVVLCHHWCPLVQETVILWERCMRNVQDVYTVYCLNVYRYRSEESWCSVAPVNMSVLGFVLFTNYQNFNWAQLGTDCPLFRLLSVHILKDL